MRVASLVLVLTFTLQASGQSLLLDINTSGLGSHPRQLTAGGDWVFFSAEVPGRGRELYRVHGGSGQVEPLAETLPGPDDLNPFIRAVLGERLVYSTNDGKIWGAGSQGPEVLLAESSPSGGGTFDGRWTFVTQSGLWITDGTAQGTVRLLAGRIRGIADYRGAPPAQGGNFYFLGRASNQLQWHLWRSDGTPDGTVPVAEARPMADGAISGDRFVGAGYDEVNGHQVWSIGLDGSSLARHSDFGPSPQAYRINHVTASGTQVFFTATDYAVGSELFRTDGTTAGTVLVRDINPGDPASYPEDLTPFGSGIVFSAVTATTGRELWFSNGSPSGTYLLRDINPGAGTSAPVIIAAREDLLYFCADDGEHGMELWITDGTPGGTKLLSDILPGRGPSAPESAAVTPSFLFVSARSSDAGQEVFMVDDFGQATLVADLNPDLGASSLPRRFVGLGHRAVFVADDGRNGLTLWTTDGTADGTVSLGVGPEANLVPVGRHPDGLGAERALFFAEKKLWSSDGTASGTRPIGPQVDGQVSEILANSELAVFVVGLPSSPQIRVADPATGEVLNTFEGAKMGLSGDLVGVYRPGEVEFWRPGSAPWVLPLGNRRVRLFEAAGPWLYFVLSTSGQPGARIWRTDGTAVGTVELGEEDLPSAPTHAAGLGERLLFTAQDGIYATDSDPKQLWKLAPTASQQDPGFTVVGGSLYGEMYFVTRGMLGTDRVMVSDGTPEGTATVKVFQDQWSSGAELLGDRQGYLLFNRGPEEGLGQLWIGNRDGAWHFGNPIEGVGPVSPEHIAIAGASMVFGARDSQHGQELWHMPALLVGVEPSDERPDALPLEAIYPNPASGDLVLRLGGAANSTPAQIEVFDARGARVHQETVASAGEVTMDAARWAAGVYYVRVTIGRRIETRSVSVLR